MERSTTNRALSLAARRTKRLQARRPEIGSRGTSLAEKLVSRTISHKRAIGRSLSTIDQDNLMDNVVDSLEKADKPMRMRMVDRFTTADSELGARVAQGLHL
jgi:catalase